MGSATLEELLLAQTQPGTSDRDAVCLTLTFCDATQIIDALLKLKRHQATFEETADAIFPPIQMSPNQKLTYLKAVANAVRSMCLELQLLCGTPSQNGQEIVGLASLIEH